MPIPKLLTSQQAADLLTIREGTLRIWRLQGKGPRFRRIGQQVRYDEADVVAYINAQTYISTSQRAPVETAAI
jgi:predicted site-specific integrase-resolvase